MTGRAFKLENNQGAVLGEITIPERWEQTLERSDKSHRSSVCFIMPLSVDQIGQRQGSLTQSYYRPDRLVLVGVTPEEFKKLDGCSFSPN